MQRMHLTSEQRTLAINLFNEGKKEGFPLDEVLAQFKREAFRRRNLVQMLLEILISTALADGSLHNQEERTLQHIAARLNWRSAEFAHLLLMVSGQAQFGDIQAESKKLNAAYDLLGVQESVTDQELKKSYRRLMNQHHPDKLVAKGLPEEMIDIATQKTQDIKAAYELIKKHRS